jgi:hypothetical protein
LIQAAACIQRQQIDISLLSTESLFRLLKFSRNPACRPRRSGSSPKASSSIRMPFLALIPPELLALLLAVSVLFVTYLTVLYHTAPNPSPTERSIPDRVGSSAQLGCSPSGDMSKSQRFEPSPLWNSETIAFISMIMIAALMRLMAYRQLGPNFIFHLATPGILIPTGKYGWVQPPNYRSSWL